MNEYGAMVEVNDREKSKHYQNHPSANLFMTISTQAGQGSNPGLHSENGN
jgi:hypothetical protein